MNFKCSPSPLDVNIMTNIKHCVACTPRNLYVLRTFGCAYSNLSVMCLNLDLFLNHKGARV